MPGCVLACVSRRGRIGEKAVTIFDVRGIQDAYGVVGLNEGVVDGDDLDIVVLDAADGN
jgi:hypothetical protein